MDILVFSTLLTSRSCVFRFSSAVVENVFGGNYLIMQALFVYVKCNLRLFKRKILDFEIIKNGLCFVKFFDLGLGLTDQVSNFARFELGLSIEKIIGSRPWSLCQHL